MSFKHFFLSVLTLGILAFGGVKASASAENIFEQKKTIINYSTMPAANYFVKVEIDGRYYLIEYDEECRIVSIIEIEE